MEYFWQIIWKFWEIGKSLKNGTLSNFWNFMECVKIQKKRFSVKNSIFPGKYLGNWNIQKCEPLDFLGEIKKIQILKVHIFEYFNHWNFQCPKYFPKFQKCSDFCLQKNFLRKYSAFLNNIQFYKIISRFFSILLFENIFFPKNWILV